MRWSKLRTLAIDRFAEPLQKRLDIHSAAYGACTCGHVWMTLDGEMIANFCTRAYYIATGREKGHPAGNPMYKHQLAASGERSRQQVYQTLWDFVHTIPVDDALASDDMLLQALAIVDARIGKRRLEQLDAEKLHPLAAYLLMLRTGEAEGITPADYAALRRNGPIAQAA
jgi:hypothetical protein